MAAKRYWEVATIRRFAIYVNNWETFGTEGQWPLSGGGRYTEVAAIRGSTVYLIGPPCAPACLSKSMRGFSLICHNDL